MKTIILFLFSILLYEFVPGQNNVDSIIIKYLKKQPNIPRPRIIKEKQGKQVVVSRNYFFNQNLSLSQNNYKISTYLFGSSVEDAAARKYLLIVVKGGSKENYKIIDDKNIEQAIRNLLSYIKPYNLPDKKKDQLINQLTIAYY